MTFNSFQTIVKKRYPQAEVFPHGKFGGNSKIDVKVVFTPLGKCYEYSGSYCYVLNRLGIKAIYAHDLRGAKCRLEWLKTTHGKPNIFSGVAMDNTEAIAECEAMIRDYEENYVVI